MTYPIVSLNGNDYDVYGDQDSADLYLAGSMTADGWTAATDDTKAKALISATRWLNGLRWLGAPADSSQTLAWPRTGISGVDSTTIPTNVAYATFEIAAALVDDPTLFTSLNDPMVSQMSAGPVSVSYFRPTAPFNVQVTTPVPKAAMAYLTAYLGGISAGGPITSGISDTSPFADDYDFEHGV